MANLRQDRVLDPTLPHASAPSSEGPAVNGHPSGRGEFVLSLRLRTQDSSGAPVAVSWAGSSPAAALALDLVKASGGLSDQPQGMVLPVRFGSLQSALLAARRLSWALEGLAESAGAPIIADLAIHSPGDPLAVALASPGLAPETGPGRILLSASLAEAVQQLPGLTLRAATRDDWRELEWRSEDRPTFAADEQSMLGFMRALGRKDPVGPRPQPPATAAVPPLTATPAIETPIALGRPYEEPETAPPIWKKPWVLAIAALAVIILAALLVIPGMLKSSKAPAADAGIKAAPPVTSPAGASNVAPTPSGPAAAQTPPPKPSAKGTRQPRVESKSEPKTDAKLEPKTSARPEPKIDAGNETPLPPKQQAGSCDLTEGEIPNSISRAERLMYQGKLAEAQSAFQRLAGCSSAREKALEGLQRVKQRIAAQSPSAQ